MTWKERVLGSPITWFLGGLLTTLLLCALAGWLAAQP